jgi:hypothetical protein
MSGIEDAGMEETRLIRLLSETDLYLSATIWGLRSGLSLQRAIGSGKGTLMPLLYSFFRYSGEQARPRLRHVKVLQISYAGEAREL